MIYSNFSNFVAQPLRIDLPNFLKLKTLLNSFEFYFCAVRLTLSKRQGIKMTDVPTISITQDENDNDFDNEREDGASPMPNISECHTDVEDLESDNDRRNSLISSLKKVSKCNGAVTDVEDFDDSEGIDEEPDKSYGPEISLNEYLDQGCVDEMSNLKGAKPKNLVSMNSVVRSPSPSAFNLGITHDTGGVTDCEDLEASGDDDDENEKVYSDDEKPIILEGINAVDIHDSVGCRKKVEKYAPRIVEPSSSASLSSDSDDGKIKPRFKSQKHFTKRGPRCNEAKSDVENIFLSDEERRKSLTKFTPVLDTPDIEVMAFDGSDNEDVSEATHFPVINITFSGSEKPKKKTKYRTTPAPSTMLKLPENQDEAKTDVENLDSSEDDEEQRVKIKSKNLIPIAIIKSDALTDVEDFDDGSDDDCDLDDNPEVPLPSPTRELTVLVENNTGKPAKQTTPLPDNLLLGFQDLDADKGLTDVEDFSDDSDADKEYEAPEIEFIPDLDGGVVESSDHTTGNTLSLSLSSRTPEPKTDTEDIFVKQKERSSECRRRRPKTKQSQNNKQKSNFLDTKLYVDLGAADGLTDVEDLDLEDDDVLLKDRRIRQRPSPVESSSRKSSFNTDGKTDVEYMSGDDNIDLLGFSPEINPSLIGFQLDSCTMTMARDMIGFNRDTPRELKLPEIRKLSVTPESCNNFTDVEDVLSYSDNEDVAASCSRAQATTPMELNRDLEELCRSEVHEIHSRAFDRVRERNEIKENLCLVDSHTDVENFDEDLPNDD